MLVTSRASRLLFPSTNGLIALSVRFEHPVSVSRSTLLQSLKGASVPSLTWLAIVDRFSRLMRW